MIFAQNAFYNTKIWAISCYDFVWVIDFRASQPLVCDLISRAFCIQPCYCLLIFRFFISLIINLWTDCQINFLFSFFFPKYTYVMYHHVRPVPVQNFVPMWESVDIKHASEKQQQCFVRAATVEWSTFV